jgi:hypothetical protein
MQGEIGTLKTNQNLFFGFFDTELNQQTKKAKIWFRDKKDVQKVFSFQFFGPAT